MSLVCGLAYYGMGIMGWLAVGPLLDLLLEVLRPMVASDLLFFFFNDFMQFAIFRRTFQILNEVQIEACLLDFSAPVIYIKPPNRPTIVCFTKAAPDAIFY